ncbi:unnamed protein product [Rotaria socialis]|uniref:Dynein heavy chain n=1 Tax=Rotaria socialis TaxID=392032 RepID=A0A818C5T2_9BILA|nr:unnamed protein product [Rotaria socialis]CAF4245169.1 unnamed protein product [Rotaria socialis]
MHGPITLQNIYQAIPAATLQFAEDEYVWHANRPVNMILATGVQLPNVLIDSVANTNIESEQFFSRMIEDIIVEYQKRHPSDHYSALKQWKQKHENDQYIQSTTPRRMNGFETLVDVVQRRHLGKLQRYFLNVVSTNRHYNPYDLITVPECKVDPENHYLFSVFGILNIRQNGIDVEFYELAEWYRHAKLWHACRQIPFFKDYLIRKEFNLWLSNARFSRFSRRRSEISKTHLLLMNNRIFQMALLEIRRVILEYQQITLLPKMFPGMSLSLNDFETMVKRHTKDTIEYTKKFYNHIKTILDMTRDTCGKKLHIILQCLEEDSVTFNISAGSIYEQRIRKENLRKELEQMQNDMRNICPFLNLCSAMLASCLCDIQRDTLSKFVLTNVTFLTKLHLSDFDSNRMLRYLPSWDDYSEIFQSILQQPQQMLYEQWKSILELDTCLRDADKVGDIIRQEGLVSQCEKCGQELYSGLQETSSSSCKCQKQKSKASTNESNNLSIKGHGFFGSTNRHEVLPFELIFTKDIKYKTDIKDILSQFRLSFDELDAYCESNEWLCEINRFCLQWTPNQMKQMSEDKQVFLIEEQLNLLRGWIDKTRTFELTYSTANGSYVVQMDCSVISQGLCNKVERIYSDFGKYLYRYACSNAQILINKFQTALQIFDQRPSAIEDFAKYASYLAPHKVELSSNQQTIEYFTNLFDMIFMHFGHLRQDNENELIDKSLTDTWKLFQKKLSDAADFVAQQTLIIKQRLRDTFEKYLDQAELLYNQSTSGIFLDSRQDPMEMVKQLKKNCIDFMGLEKQLRQYAEWQTLLATNSLSSVNEDHVDNADIQSVNRWSIEIDLRKDLWKYLEITSSAIKEWKNTFINKFNIRRAHEKLECWLKIAEDFKEKISDDDPIVLHWISMLQDFEENLELLKKLLSDAMTAEQWKVLFRANGHEYDPQYNYRIQDLIDLKILQIENQAVFIQIHKQATREQKLKDKLMHMQTWLSELHYRMAKYRPPLKIATVRNRLTSSYRQRLSRYREIRSRTPTAQKSPPEAILTTDLSAETVEEAYIMINSQEILRLIEDRLLLLHSNESFHSNIDNRHEQFQQYYALFDNVKEMTQLWFETQNRWIFLRSALANLKVANDDQTYLKQIYIKFADIDESFRNFQKLAFQNPSVAGLAKVEMNRVHFQNWLDVFNQLIVELDFYLNEQYRSKFGRFNFLSNEDLVNLISSGLDPRFYVPYVRQLFRGVHNIEFHLPEQTIGTTNNQTMNSAAIDVYAYRLEGISLSNRDAEQLKLISKLKLSLPIIDSIGLSTHIISSQSLTKWFQSLEKLIKYSLAKLIFELIENKLNEQLTEILFKQISINSEENQYPLQVTLLVEHILFSIILKKQIEKQGKLFIRMLKFKIENQINAITTNRTKQQNCLILQKLYFRDILSKLIEIESNLTLNSYEWLSLIKYEVNQNCRTENKINFVQFSNRIAYNFEFIEPSSTFVISPMMERTIFQLTQAICAYRIGVVHAPAQYGRSTIIQTLAQLCGTNCISLLCNSSTKVNQIENIHQGLVTSNSWCLFKDIWQLSIDCLSSLAVAMRYIRVQLEEHQIISNNSNRSLKRFKSQSDIFQSSLSSNINENKTHSNEYPMRKKNTTEYNYIITHNQEFIQYPFTYGIFATLDNHYRTLSSTIKFECRTISMSCPDFKIIAELLLYKNHLFTINEQEDCRETARNLVDFIEYLRLIFNEIKSFCSPYILLQSIIEQSIDFNVREAIVIVLKRYQLYDSNIPKILDRFFIENENQSNEKDDELCFVDSLKQEAYDDKITFDNDQIFNHASRLIYALKRNDLIFITGQCGSAKSSLIRLVERTINKQMSTVSVDSTEDEQQKLVIINKVFPNSFDADQFYHAKNSFIEQWKRYYETTVATDATFDQYWIVLDVDSHSNWLTPDNIQYLYNEFISSLSHHNGSIKLMIECDQLPNEFYDNCSVFNKTFIINLDKFQSSMKLIQSAARNLEIKLHLLDSTLASIKDFVNDIIEPYTKYIENEHICDFYVNNFTDSFIKILSAFIEQHLIDVQHNHDVLDYIFVYCFIWAYVHPIHVKYEEQVVSFVRQLLKSYDFPPLNCKLTDLYPDMNASSSARFVLVRSWLKVNEITYDCIPEFEGAMRLMSMLIASNYPLGIYSYEQGFGKTTLMKRLLTNIHHLRLISSSERKSLLHDELFKHNLPILTHGKSIRGTKFVVWVEDVKQEDTELIRSWIDEYSSSKHQDLNIVLTGQSFYSYPSRFSRHFVPIIIHQSISTLIGSIYSIPIKDWLEEFSADAISHPIELAHACLLTLEEIFDFLRQHLNKIKWNLHHVESVINGMLLLDGKVKRAGLGGTHKELNKLTSRLNKKKQQDEQVATIVRLLCHEISRTILDRLKNQKDRFLFQDFLYKTIIANFCTELEFHVVSINEGETNNSSQNNNPAIVSSTITMGKKQVKFKLGLVSDRAALASLEGPIVPFGKLIGLPKIKDPSKVTNSEEIIEKLSQSTYFSKQILIMHGDYIGDRNSFTNQYQESDNIQISTALRSCQSRMSKSARMDLSFIPRTCRHVTNLVRVFCLPNNGHALLRTNHIGLGRQDLVQLSAYITRQQFFDAHSSAPSIDENESVKQCLRSSCLLAGLKQKNVVVLVRENLLSDEMIKQLYIFTCEGTYPNLYSNEELIRIAAALSPNLPTTRRVTKTNAVLKTFYARIRKRFHLVILENSQQPRHEGLLSSCYVDEYGNWTIDEIISISKYWMANKIDVLYPIESTSIFDVVSQALAEIYLSMDHYRLFTLKSVQKAIEFFYKFYQHVQEKEETRLSRCESMLNRSNKSERIIELNSRFCIQLQNEIDEIQEKLVKLDANFAVKKKNFSTAVEDCREEEKLLSEMSIALDRLRQDAQADVDKASPQYENALKALKMLNKADYDEIRTFRQPPQPVLAVMNTICIMFQKKPEWSEAKILMVKENFFDDLIFYDKDNMPDDVFNMLTKIVKFDTFHPSFVASSSKAASSLCAWILAVYEYAKIARSQKTKLEQVKTYQELYNKRQHILGEKRIKAEKLRGELSELILERRSQTNELQLKKKRQNHFQSTIDKTRSMLKLIDDDIQFWQKQVDEGKLNKKTAITDALLASLYFCYLSQFNIDQREKLLLNWQTKILENILPIQSNFNPLNIIINQKEFNDYLLKQEVSSMADQNSLLNAISLSNQLDNTFVLFINNPEDDTSAWNDLLTKLKSGYVEKANHEIELYYEYKQNQINASSADTRIGSYQDRSQIYSRISSSKTYITEITEKSSLWESSTAISRPATSMLLTKSAGSVALSDLEQNKHLVSIPEFSLEQYQRPENNIIHLSGKQTEDFDKTLLAAMFFGVIVIIDECEFLKLNSFLYRFLRWSLRQQQYLSIFPNLYRFGDQDIFINSSFRLIFNFRQIDRIQWKNISLKCRLIDMSLSLSKLENDLWLRLVELKCQNNVIQQIRSNQRNHLIAINEQVQRREKLIDILETKENLTIDSEDLLTILNNFHCDRVSIENSLNEHQVQREIICSRTGCEAYRETAKHLAKLYILLRDSEIELKIPIKWFIQIVTNNLSRRIETNTNTNTTTTATANNNSLDMISKVQARETYLRCFESIYSYLSSSMSNDHLQCFLIIFALIKQENKDNIQLLEFILKKLNPLNQQIIPNFLDDQKRPSFINSHSWLLCLSDEINAKYPNLTEHLIDYQHEWKEYLYSTTKIDFINKSPLEKTTTLNIIDRFILLIILKPEKIFEITRTFLVYHYGGFLHDKSLSSIDDIYQLTSSDILKPMNNIILVWTNSSAFVDPINEIRTLANQMKKSLRLVSSIDKKRLSRFIHSKKDCWLIIKDINLFNDDLLQIRDFMLSSIDNKIWLMCDPSYATKVPLWLTQRCLHVYLSDSTQASFELRLQQKILSEKQFPKLEKQIEQIVHIHSYIITKKIFSNNWMNFVESDFYIDLKHLFDTNQMNMIDYANYIENDDEHILMKYIKKSMDPSTLVKTIPDPSQSMNNNLFLIFERFFESIVLPNEESYSTKEDEMLLVESIVRSYLTHFRSIYAHQHPSTPSSLIDLFIFMEYHLLKSLENDLAHQMEYLLEVFSDIEISLPKTDLFIRSILYDSNSTIQNFVANYGLALRNISERKQNNINLRFIRRRKQFIQVMRMEQVRKQDDRIFHLKYDEKKELTNDLVVSGIHSTSTNSQKDFIIYLDESSPNDTTMISAITLNTNDKNIPCYLPIVHRDIKDKSELISILSIEKPHI